MLTSTRTVWSLLIQDYYPHFESIIKQTLCNLNLTTPKFVLNNTINHHKVSSSAFSQDHIYFLGKTNSIEQALLFHKYCLFQIRTFIKTHFILYLKLFLDLSTKDTHISHLILLQCCLELISSIVTLWEHLNNSFDICNWAF